MPQQNAHPYCCLSQRHARIGVRLFGGLLPLLASGCFAVPTPYHPGAGDSWPQDPRPDFRKAIGDARSSRPLRVGVSTRAEVDHLLGSPAAQRDDGAVCVYAQQMFSGYGVILPPFYGASGPLRQRTYFLRADFDRDGILREYRVVPWQSSDAGMGYMVSTVPDRVPGELLAE